MIWLNIDEAFTHLMEHHSVYLLREIRTTEGRHVLMSSLREGPFQIGIIYAELIAELVPYTVRREIDDNGYEVGPCEERHNFNEVLRNFVPESGFEDVANWINSLKNHRKKHYLYHVFLARANTLFFFVAICQLILQRCSRSQDKG